MPTPAKRRLDRWRSQFPFDTGTYFERRLRADKLTEESLLAHLAAEPEHLARLFAAPLPWQSTFTEAFRSEAEPFEWPEELAGRPEAGFLKLVDPWMQWIRRRLREEIKSLVDPDDAGEPFDARALERVLLAELPARLLRRIIRVFTLELNVARLEERLVGDSPEERFRHFVDAFDDRERCLELLREYPVLARVVTTDVEQWLAGSLEFLRALVADWDAIRESFLPEEPVSGDPPPRGIKDHGLVRVEARVSDPHQGGRSVRIAHFSSGLKLVYKPRSLALDRHFQELLVWLNERGFDPPLRPLVSIDRGTYGWMEFVAGQPCGSRDEVHRFYRRQGAYLALLFALDASDFHFENLIAEGEHPILVDLETLFQPHLEDPELRGPDFLAGRILNRSVLRTGLLPQRQWGGGNDISGLGAERLPSALLEAQVADQGGSDTMRFVRRRLSMSEGRHRPTLSLPPLDPPEGTLSPSEDVALSDYKDDLRDGFTAAYRLLLQHREDLLADDGPIAAFVGDELRVVMRPTRVYGALINESFHPRLLGDALLRDRFYDRLWVDVPDRPGIEHVLPFERFDLWRNDVPRFTTRTNSRDLWSSTGERLADFFLDTGLERSQERLRQWSEDHLREQLWLIQASLLTLEGGVETTPVEWSWAPAESPGSPQGDPEVTSEAFLAAARSIGEHLEALAMRVGDRSTWIGLQLLGDNAVAVRPLLPDLYSGLSGIALFLAQLGARTGEERFTELARCAWRQIRGILDEERDAIWGIGAFYGWGAILYTTLHLASLWREPSWLGWAQEWVDDLVRGLEDDVDLDVISGAAGAVLGLLRLHEASPSPRTLEAAVACGDKLLTAARPAGPGIGWWNRAAKKRPISGLSHGNAGIAWALAELASRSGEARFREAALGALAYERSTFSYRRDAWPDLRFFDEQGHEDWDEAIPKSFPAWCHGAAGIALTRAALLEHLGDDAEQLDILREEIRVGVRITLEHGFGHAPFLCHGDFGNLDLLLFVQRAVDDEDLGRHLRKIAASVFESLERQSGKSRGSYGLESPGLMVGLAGSGYGLLRLAAPGDVPSVLALEKPKG